MSPKAVPRPSTKKKKVNKVPRFVAQKAFKKKNPLTVSGGKHKEPLRIIYTLQYVPRFVAQSSTKKKNPLTELQGKHKKDKSCLRFC